MTDDLGWVGLGVRPDFTGFPSALSRGVTGPLDRAGHEGGNRFVSGMRSSVRRGVASIVAPLAGAFGAYQIFNLARDSAAEARESIKVGALTASTLKATGGAANVSQKQIERLSGALSAKIGVDDEAIQSSANLLLTFKNVANEGKHSSAIFNRAVRDSQDISAEGFGSTESASKMLGKALNDPVKGMSALTRAGVTFTQQQIDQVKALVASGDTLKAQKIILREVEGQVGGAAEAQADSFDKLGVVVGNVKEDIGLAFMPVADDLADFLAKRGPAAGKKFADFLRDDAVPQIKSFADQARPLAEELLPAIGSVLGDVRDVLKEAAPYAKDLVGAFNDMPDWAKKGVAVGGLSLLAASKTGLIGKPGKQGAVSSLISGSRGSSPANALYVIPVGGSLTGGDSPILGGGPDGKTKGGRLKRPRISKGSGALLLASLGFDLFGPTDTNPSDTKTGAGGALSNTLTGGAAGSLFGPYGAGAGAFIGFSKWLTDETNVPNSQLPVSKYEKDLAARENFGADLGAGDNPLTSWVGDLEKEIHGLQIRKIQPKFDILGLIEAEAKVETFRQRAEKPVQVPIVADVNAALQDFFGGIFGDDTPSTSGRGKGRGRSGGVTVNVDKMVAQDYRDMHRQLQAHSQQAALGGRPVGS